LIELPKNESHGDLYTNAAMVFAKDLGLPPQAIAKHIITALEKDERIEKANIAGPGFVNFKLTTNAWNCALYKILEEKEKYGTTNVGNNKRVNIEFVSANPTGPLHTGHARNAVLGSTIANLLEKIGYKVTREFYINDQGNQIKALARSLYMRYKECLGTTLNEFDFTDDMYCAEYIKDIAKELVDLYGDEFLNKEEDKWIETIGKFAINKILVNIKEDLKLIGVEMDVYTSEAAICKKNMVNEALEILTDLKDVYEGIIPKPKGTDDVEDWEERPQTLFRASKYGDDVDRAIRKSDGTWTYFAGDIAYHLDKIQRKYEKIINILGADHNGYVKRIKAAVKALSSEKVVLDVQLYQLVNFLENGKLIKMSKRSGVFITLKEIVERVGKDATRFMMISRHHDVMIDFDFAKIVEHSMDNPIFYIQYAYARISSVFRNVVKVFPDIGEEDLLNYDKSCLVNVTETNLIKNLCRWPEYVVSAAIALEPHRIPNYLYQIASLFHTLWSKGKVNTLLRFIDEKDKTTTIARLALLKAIKIVLADGLKLMGVTPMEEMR
jgi:arginyl-tRNA synthetase